MLKTTVKYISYTLSQENVRWVSISARPCVGSCEVKLVLRSCLSLKKGISATVVSDSPWYPPNLAWCRHVQAHVSRSDRSPWRYQTFMSTLVSTHSAQVGTFYNKIFVTIYILPFHMYITSNFLLCRIKKPHDEIAIKHYSWTLHSYEQ